MLSRIPMMGERRGSGRPTKHDWSDKKDVCYKLYIEERRHMRDVVNYFTTALGVDESQVPTPRDFCRQFKRWGFPSRQFRPSAEEEARLIERIKELWQANYSQKKMLEILVDEGWELDEFTLARIRRKNDIMMRAAYGYNTKDMVPGTYKKRKRVHKQNTEDQIEVQTSQDAQDDQDLHGPTVPVAADAATTATAPFQQDSPAPLQNPPDSLLDVPPEEAARRVQRLLELQMWSDTQMQSRKRRRRIRGLAHLPPDAPDLPPRYKSETSLDECKAFLQLSNDLYKEVRQKFEEICHEMDIVKKTLCEPGVWQGGKDRLVREHIHLAAMLNPVHPDLDRRENALEVICSDVTKRMRTMKKRIFLKDANNMLGLNPVDSKELRRQFYEVLKADNFQTMLLCGKEHWEELKQRWYEGSELAQRVYAHGLDGDKTRAIEVLLRDAMKRHNDNNVAKFPHMTQDPDKSYGPGPGPARRLAKKVDASETTPSSKPVRRRVAGPALRDDGDATQESSAASQHVDLDPALFAALAPEVGSATRPTQIDGEYGGSMIDPLPVYFRLSTKSRLNGHHPKMWLATLPSLTIAALHAAANAKSGAAKVCKIHGIIKGDDGRESSYQIDGSDELEAYLETAKEMVDGKATFLVALEDKYA